MNDETAPRSQPEEFNIVLEGPRLSPTGWARFFAMLHQKQSMRQNPRERSVTIFSFGDEPDVIIVDEPAKGPKC